MTVQYKEELHPRDAHGQFIKKSLQGIKGKTPPKSFKFYKQGFKPKPMHTLQGTHVKHYGAALYKAKQEGAFDNDYEFWLAAQKLHTDAKKKHGANAPKPHAIVNAAFNHEIKDTGALNMLDSGGGPPKEPKHVHATTPSGVKMTSKFLAPGEIEPTGKKMPGVNGALVYKDADGNQWLVKFPGGSKGTSQAYSNSKFLVDLDVATSRIQNKAGLPVPSINAKEVKTPDGTTKLASVHKMYSRVSDAFPTNKPNLATMDQEDIVEIQKNMVLDWLLSNHDPHSGNFLKTDKGIIGIDKGQSFKYFGKDKLSINFGSDINPPLAPNVPVYSTLMKQAQAGQGKMDFNDPVVKTTIQRIQNIPDAEYKDALRGYAEKAAQQGLLNYPGKQYGEKPDVEKFLAAAVARKNNLATDFENLNNEINPPKKPESLEELSPQGMNSAQHLKQGDEVTWSLIKKGMKVNYGFHSGSMALTLDKPVGPSVWATKQHNGVEGPKLYKVYFNEGSVTFESHGDAKPAEKENSGVPEGYKIVQHPTMPEKYTIQKPNGEFSKTPDGVVKSWATPLDAQESSVMKKYKNQAAQSAQFAQQQAQSQMAGAQAFAQSAPENDPSTQLTGSDALEYTQLKTKIAAGETFTPDEYMKLKSYVQQIKNSAKAAGAAQVEEEFEPSGFEQPAAKPAKKLKGGFKEKPKFKISGGAPPALEKATGPNALDDGKLLWEMKQAGKIKDDYQMWSEAKKLSNKAKKAAGPSGQSGVHYSSPNQIRNVAMRLEFDETGDVVWETAEEKTSEAIGQSVGQIKKTNALHEHKPVVKASASHKVTEQGLTKFPSHWDINAVVGSYTNPHSFKQGDTNALQAYGYKYTDHNIPWNQSQKSAWYNFSGSGSGNVNTFFRTGDVGLYGNIEDAKKRAKAIVDAFKSDNVKPLDDWTVVTRGTNGGWEFGIGSDAVSFEQLQGQVGKVVRNKCPVSTSLRERPAFSGAHRVTYKLPPGFRGLGIYGKSAHGHENEMILPPGMAYRILDVKKSDAAGYTNEILVEVVDVKLPEIQ